MVTFTSDNGKTIRLTDLAITLTLMVPSTRESGLRISSMAMVERNGLMELIMKGSISQARKMVMESSSGQTTHHIKVTSWTITFTDMALTSGLMGGNILETGRSTRCMALVSSHGPMEEGTKESIMTTRNREEECSHGLTAGSTTDCGRMVS